MSDQLECAKCGETYRLHEPDMEATKYCDECAHIVAEQAQFEIEALQRRLAEYAGELERVKEENRKLIETLNTRVNREVEHLNELEAEVGQLRKVGTMLAETLRDYDRWHESCPYVALANRVEEALKVARVLKLWEPK